MKCTNPDGIPFPQGRCIGGVPTVVMPADHLRTIFPLPIHRARTADGFYLLSSGEHCAGSKYRIETPDIEKNPSPEGHVCALDANGATKWSGGKSHWSPPVVDRRRVIG